MKIQIIGAGMAGMLAARMLQDHHPVIHERQSELPNNHHAVLRFRTLNVSSATGIPFKKVRVLKGICPPPDRRMSDNPVAAANCYSHKVTGRYEPRSVINLEPADRFIAPPDFIQRMAAGLSVRFGSDVLQKSPGGIRWIDVAPKSDPVISTMPINLLANALGYKGLHNLKMDMRSGWTIRGEIPNANTYCTVYSPWHTEDWYRASITGDKVMIEGVGDGPTAKDAQKRFAEENAACALRHLGVLPGNHMSWRDWGWTLKKSHYHKIATPDADVREEVKRFILWASMTHNIFSLGRFATWRPGLLLDDVVNDVWVIRRLIESGNHYEAAK